MSPQTCPGLQGIVTFLSIVICNEKDQKVSKRNSYGSMNIKTVIFQEGIGYLPQDFSYFYGI